MAMMKHFNHSMAPQQTLGSKSKSKSKSKMKCGVHAELRSPRQPGQDPNSKAALRAKQCRLAAEAGPAAGWFKPIGPMVLLLNRQPRHAYMNRCAEGDLIGRPRAPLPILMSRTVTSAVQDLRSTLIEVCEG